MTGNGTLTFADSSSLPVPATSIDKNRSLFGIFYQMTRDEFCDWYIELAKYPIWHADENPKAANAALWTLKTVLANGLKLLHPFMPFVSEEIYSVLVPEEESLMMSSWPQYKEEWNFAQEETQVERMKEIIRGVRNIRAEMNVAPSRKAQTYVV